MSDLGKLLIMLGAVLVAAGLIVIVAGRLPWLGRLPGDILIRRRGFVFYFPFASCLVASIVLSLLLYLLRR